MCVKDDKRYPYIRVTWQDPFPSLSVTRMMINDGSRYFGPYTSVWAVHQTLDVLRKIFSIPYLCPRNYWKRLPVPAFFMILNYAPLLALGQLAAIRLSAK